MYFLLRSKMFYFTKISIIILFFYEHKYNLDELKKKKTPFPVAPHASQLPNSLEHN